MRTRVAATVTIVATVGKPFSDKAFRLSPIVASTIACLASPGEESPLELAVAGAAQEAACRHASAAPDSAARASALPDRVPGAAQEKR